MRLRHTIAAIVLGAAAAAGWAPAGAQDADRLKVINCYDSDRNLVRRVPVWRCDGEIVSDVRAREIRESRIRRARGRMERETSAVAGMRMRSSGTGFFVSREGHVVTNHHVIDSCRRITVKPTEADEHAIAELIAADVPDDLAVLKHTGKVPEVGRFRLPLYLERGNRIGVVGHPLHGLVAIKPVLVIGSVRDIMHPDLVRMGRFAINADVRRGNSGGPVLDDAGFVVGVVSAKVDTPAMYKRTGTVVRDVGLIVRQERVITFLRAHKVPYVVAQEGPRLSDDALEEAANGFVARIGCWR